MAWSFALAVLGEEPSFQKIGPAIIQACHQMVEHIDSYFDYTRRAVPNNHLLAECLALLLGSTLFPTSVPKPSSSPTEDSSRIRTTITAW